MVRKHVTRREDYTVLEPQPPAQPVGAMPPVAIESPQEAEERDDLLDYEDEIERFLNELDQERGYALRVDKLPDFKRTGNWNPGRAVVPREFQGEIPFSVHSYLSDIQSLYGPGDFLLTLKDSSRQIVRKWPERIGGPVQPPLTPAVAGSTGISTAVPAKQGEPEMDSIEGFVRVAERLTKLRKAMGWEHEPPQAAPVLSPTAEPPRTLEEKIFEKLFDLAGSREDVADRLLSKYLQPEKEDFSWSDVIKEVLKPIAEAAAPLVPALIGAYLRGTQPAALGGTAAGAPPPRPTAVPSAMPPMGPHAFTGRSDQWCEVCNLPDRHPIHNRTPLTSATVAPEPDGLEDEAPQMELIDSLVKMLDFCIRQSVADPAVIEQGYKEVQEFETAHPFLAAFVHSLASGPPEMVLGILLGVYPELSQALVGNPVALEAIAALQAKLKGEDQ